MTNAATLEATASLEERLKATDISPLIASKVNLGKKDLLSGEYAADLRELLERRGVLVFPEIKFTDAEVANLRRYLDSGGFLWIDDDFGMAPSVRRELRRIFPDAPMVELPFSHPIFHGLYSFPAGLPKIHEHEGEAPHAFGVVREGRLVVLFTHETDIGDGLEDAEVHRDPAEKREAALRFALNVVHFALTQ